MRAYQSRIVQFLVAAIALSLSGAASAQWQVIDNEQISQNKSNLEDLKSNDNENTNKLNDTLTDIYNSHKIGASTGDKPSGEEVEDPEQKLEKVSEDYGIAACAGQTGGTPVADEQKETCELMQRTRNSQFNYMVAMHEITTKRLERLREIEKERTNIDETQIGKLEDNTNKLIALKTLMDIDRQQMQSAMFAYESRLAYLSRQQTAQSRSAMSGKKYEEGSGGGIFDSLTDGLKSAIGGIAAGVVLKGALETVKSDRPDGMQRLNIDD